MTKKVKLKGKLNLVSFTLRVCSVFRIRFWSNEMHLREKLYDWSCDLFRIGPDINDKT